jgi:hypothetical protein
MGLPASWYGKVDEMIEGLGGSPLNPDGSRTYTRKFLVEVKPEGKYMGSIGVCSHPLLPRPWSFYSTQTEYDELALLTGYQAERREQGDYSLWVVTGTWSTVNTGDFNTPTGGAPGDLPSGSPAGGAAGNAYDNPEYEYPEISWNFEDMQRPALVDLLGVPYQNTALQPYTPPPTFPQSYQVLHITRNELNYNAAVAQEYAYAVNDVAFLGYPQDFVQCMPPQAVQKFKGRLRYWRVTYRIRFHPRDIWLPRVTNPNPPPVIVNQFYELNWQPHMQSQGYMRLDDRVDGAGNPINPATFGKAIPIIGDGGHPITQQVLLDQFGQRATVKDPVSGLVVPYFTRYRQYKRKDMANLIARGFV